MCNCKDNIKVGEYTNQSILRIPRFMNKYWNKETICVDNCLVEEINKLWKLGIITTGCCCGHNLQLPYIGVTDEYVDIMISIGYKIQLNSCGVENCLRYDTFYPKTVLYTKEQYVDNVKHLIFQTK